MRYSSLKNPAFLFKRFFGHNLKMKFFLGMQFLQKLKVNDDYIFNKKTKMNRLDFC